jgi:hypothetical protein
LNFKCHKNSAFSINPAIDSANNGGKYPFKLKY